MMKDLENNPTVLINHENNNLYFETFDKNIRKLNSITEEIHYFRNTLNSYSGAPSSLDEMITLASEHKWKLFSAKFHRYNNEDVNAALNPLKYYKHYLFDLTPWKKWGNVAGVSNKDIMSLESKHGSVEQKKSTKVIEQLIGE